MGWFKQLCLSWIILSAAAVSGSCQELTSTLREGNRTCPGEEVIFTCTIRGPSTLSVIAVAWSSTEYIGQGGSLQLSTADMIGVTETSGSTTATATVTNNTNINGELILESTLHITAVEASTVTCTDPNQGPASIEFTVSALPGVPQSISATEISRPIDTLCIILVQWDPPANSDASDIDQYIVYVPSRNIEVTVSSSSPLTTLTIMNCGDDIRVQVAAVNRGCVGMNSSEVPLILLDIPNASTTNGSGTTEVESTPIDITSQLGAGAIAGIAIGSTIGFCFVVLVIAAFPCGYLLRSLWRHLHPKKEIMPEGESLKLLPKAEDNVDYIWDLQKNASLEAKDCYQKQSQHDFDKLGTEKHRISVPILIDDKLDDSWKDSLREAVKAINEAAPGLSLSITNNKEQAIINVLAIQESEPDKKESHHTKGNILLRSSSGQANYITTIYLGKSEDDAAKKGISTRELFHALGVHEDNDYGLTRFDPTSITLYQNEKAYESARKQHPGDLVLWIKTKDPKLSELDKVCLNLIHRPCRGDKYTPKLGQTGLYYCGRSVMSDHTYPDDHDKHIDGICGPNHGPNCPACRTIKSKKVEEILIKQKWQGMTGRVYCGRLFANPTEYHNGVCGMNNGPACPDCVELLNKEI